MGSEMCIRDSNKRTCVELLRTQGLTPVTQQQGKAVATKMGALYMECSSKEMIGVHEIFETAIDIAVRGQEEPLEETSKSSSAAKAPRLTAGGQVMPARKKKSRSCKIL